MTFLTGLANIGQGYSQARDQGAALMQKYQAIQQGKLQLDQAQKQVQAEAAVFAGLGGPQGGAAGIASLAPPPGPMTQPMMPGQSSQPNQLPPQGGPAPSPAASTLPPPAAGSPAPPPQGGGGSLPGVQQGGGIDPTDPQAAVKTVMSIAREIKSRNPDITPELLFMATGHIIDMSKGIAPQLRQGAQVVVQQMRDATSQANTLAHVGATERGQDMTSQNTDKRIGSQEKIAAGHDATSLQRTAQQGENALKTAQYVQGQIGARQDNSLRGKAITDRFKAVNAQLTTAVRQLGVLKNPVTGQLDDKDPRVQKAQKDLAQASASMDILAKAVGQPAAGGAPAASGGNPAPAPAQRGPATHMLKGKPIWPENGKWVYEDGSEAK